MRSTLVILAALAALAALGGAVSAAESHQLSGTLAHAAVDDGVNAYLKLVGPDEACTDPGPGRYAGQTVFSEGEASFVLEGVVAGEYTGCFFIDTDDNVMVSQGPTSGDYGAIKTVTINEDTMIEVTETEWGKIP